MKQKFEIHITEDSAEIKGNTVEILEGLAFLIHSLKKSKLAGDELIKEVVNKGLKYKEK